MLAMMLVIAIMVCATVMLLFLVLGVNIPVSTGSSCLIYCILAMLLLSATYRERYDLFVLGGGEVSGVEDEDQERITQVSSKIIKHKFCNSQNFPTVGIQL